jgi:hypothetical protein
MKASTCLFRESENDFVPNFVQVTPQSFDDVGTGLISLFEMSSRDGWTAVMAAAVDSAGIDMQPQRYAASPPSLYLL